MGDPAQTDGAAGAADPTPTEVGITPEKARASSQPGPFAGHKNAEAVGDPSLRLKCSLCDPLFPQTETDTQANARGYSVSPIPDTGIRLFLAVKVAHEALPVQPAHGRGYRQAIVQGPGPRKAPENHGQEAKRQQEALLLHSAFQLHLRRKAVRISTGNLGF